MTSNSFVLATLSLNTFRIINNEIFKLDLKNNYLTKSIL